MPFQTLPHFYLRPLKSQHWASVTVVTLIVVEHITIIEVQ